MAKKQAPRNEPERENADVGMEGAAEEDSGVIRRQAGIERGDEISIGGSPPSGAGGTIGSPAPNQDDVKEIEEGEG